MTSGKATGATHQVSDRRGLELPYGSATLSLGRLVDPTVKHRRSHPHIGLTSVFTLEEVVRTVDVV